MNIQKDTQQKNSGGNIESNTIEIKGDPKCLWCWGRFYVRVIRDGKLVNEPCRCVRLKRRKLEHRKFEEGLAAAAEKKKTGHAT